MTIDEAKKLSPEEINKTIAEALGWKLVKEECPPDPFGDFPDGFVIDSWVSPEGEESKYPDYFHDLNAVHEAEKALFRFDETNTYKRVAFSANRSAHVEDLKHGNCDIDLEMLCTPANIRAVALACVLSERKK